MKNLLTILFLILIIIPGIAQQKIIDYSPDGKSVNKYEITLPIEYGKGYSLFQDVPYGFIPSWAAKRDRQIAALAFADYDGDGDLDLGVACYSSQSFPPITEFEAFIFRNDNGLLDTFPGWISSVEKSANDMGWADINRDGLVDFLSANGSFVKSDIYFNSASGLSTTPGWTSNDNNWTVGSAFCDVDGDGDLDMAFANQGLGTNPYRPINIFYNNNGVMSTTAGWTSADQMITNSVAFADMNNSDLASVTNLSYTATGSQYSFFIPMVPIYKLDSVTVNGVKKTGYAYDGLNGWISLGYKPTAGSVVNIYYRYIRKGDMAGAKWANFESGVYFDNNGVLNTSPGWTVGNTETQKGIAWADIDLDGYLDLAIGGNGDPNVIYKNNAGVLSTTPIWQSVGTTGVQDLKFADVNKDGYPDLSVVHFGNRRVDIFINRGGILDSEPTWSWSPTTSSTAIAFGDINGDGWLDLAIGTARQPVLVFLADPSLLPVELTSFIAFEVNNSVSLTWRTATELNNRGFDIERRNLSINNSWQKIASMNGAGSSSSEKTYSYSDIPEASGKYQYRLKQIDFDGTQTYSAVTEVEYSGKFDFTLDQNYPNPFNPSTSIKFTIPSDGFVNVKVFDILGRETASLLNEAKSKGTYNIKFDASNLVSGIYLYQINHIDNSGHTTSLTRKMNLIK